MILIKLAGIAAITYFVSRLTLLLPLFPSRRIGLGLAHIIAFGIEALIIALLRLPLGVFAALQLLAYAIAHLAWLQVDIAMRNYPKRTRSKS